MRRRDRWIRAFLRGAISGNIIRTTFENPMYFSAPPTLVRALPSLFLPIGTFVAPCACSLSIPCLCGIRKGTFPFYNPPTSSLNYTYSRDPPWCGIRGNIRTLYQGDVNPPPSLTHRKHHPKTSLPPLGISKIRGVASRRGPPPLSLGCARPLLHPNPTS